MNEQRLPSVEPINVAAMTPEEKAARIAEWQAQVPDIDTDYDFSARKALSSEQRAQYVFQLNAELAATSIANLAVNATNERTRLDAAKYVVERVLGRVPDTKNMSAEGDPWDGIYSAVVKEPSAAARAKGAIVNLFEAE